MGTRKREKRFLYVRGGLAMPVKLKKKKKKNKEKAQRLRDR